MACVDHDGMQTVDHGISVAGVSDCILMQGMHQSMQPLDFPLAFCICGKGPRNQNKNKTKKQNKKQEIDEEKRE